MHVGDLFVKRKICNLVAVTIHTWVNGFRMKRAMVVGGNFDRPVDSSGFGRSLAGLSKGPHQALHCGDHLLRGAFPKNVF